METSDQGMTRGARHQTNARRSTMVKMEWLQPDRWDKKGIRRSRSGNVDKAAANAPPINVKIIPFDPTSTDCPFLKL
jgi:hypothetical protein